MYISGQRDAGRRRAEEIKIPEQYSGNAFQTDTEALAIAEEAFKRGYVFDDSSEVEKESTNDATAEANAEVAHEVEAKETFGVPKNEGGAVTVHKRQGGLSGILDRLTSENIILIALILILWDSKADDELLLMLIILFFC